jgi:hypothetical protein
MQKYLLPNNEDLPVTSCLTSLNILNIHKINRAYRSLLTHPPTALNLSLPVAAAPFQELGVALSPIT